MAFFITSSPHVHVKRNTSNIMMWVALCLLPGIGAQTYFFGYGVLIQVVYAVLLAWFFEAAVMLLRKRSPLTALKDNSAMVTGMLLAVSIPPLSPWWLMAIGLFFAIVIGKHLYGGIGQNLFNPAMVAYVVLLISFPVQMTSWLAPEVVTSLHLHFSDCVKLIFSGYNGDGLSLLQVRTGIDGVTMATPLDTFKTSIRAGHTASEIMQQAPYSGLLGIGWQWVNIAFLFGGAVLLKMRIIQWQIPTAMLLSLFVMSVLTSLFDPGMTASPALQLLSGATMLGAFFIATDPITASTTTKGRLYYGGMIGVVVFLIRSWGGFPDGVAFAILLANMSVPLIDYYTKPRTYGHTR
ncbi:electron transport complex subunit RsxD [Vibrio sp. S11_S32]|uniref:electron transport complex subunit RsxD n=1 Tax=Vibrio sp. S11_S32 TaxID=2720225 RepID=UPI001681BC4C|nr:electron transport complex subunit RsxD [Vibrio sp. S11_S32]